MQYSARNIIGCAILARDGLCGEVHDVLFGDDSWNIRYVVSRAIVAGVNRDFQLAIEAIHSLNLHNRSIQFSGTVGEAQSKTHIDQDPPVSRQQQLKRTALWALGPIYELDFTWGAFPVMPFWLASTTRKLGSGGNSKERATYNPHLRSSREVIGYRVQAPDGKAGRVVDILCDDGNHHVEYLVVATRRLWRHTRVLLPLTSVHGICWSLMRVTTKLSKSAVRSLLRDIFSDSRRMHSTTGSPSGDSASSSA
jgi:hypothetical protein